MTEKIDLAKKYPKCPKPGTWLRHSDTGDLAQVVEENGDWVIKPDRPNSPVRYPATMAHKYRIEEQARKMPPGSFARVAYEADKILCAIHPDLKKQPEWQSLRAEERAKWIEGRVSFAHEVRTKLYTKIISTLEDLDV